MKVPFSQHPLQLPQHWHVGIFWYASLDANQSFQWSTHFDVVTTDLALAVAYTRERAAELNEPLREHYHVDRVEMCVVKEHVENLPSALAK